MTDTQMRTLRRGLDQTDGTDQATRKAAIKDAMGVFGRIRNFFAMGTYEVALGHVYDMLKATKKYDESFRNGTDDDTKEIKEFCTDQFKTSYEQLVANLVTLDSLPHFQETLRLELTGTLGYTNVPDFPKYGISPQGQRVKLENKPDGANKNESRRATLVEIADSRQQMLKLWNEVKPETSQHSLKIFKDHLIRFWSNEEHTDSEKRNYLSLCIGVNKHGMQPENIKALKEVCTELNLGDLNQI